MFAQREHGFILSWGDKIYSSLNSYDRELCRRVCELYFDETGHTISLGIGLTMGFAYKSMKVAKSLEPPYKIFFLQNDY